MTRQGEVIILGHSIMVQVYFTTDDWSRHTWEAPPGDYGQDTESQAHRNLVPPGRRWNRLNLQAADEQPAEVTPVVENAIPTPPAPPSHSVPPTSSTNAERPTVPVLAPPPSAGRPPRDVLLNLQQYGLTRNDVGTWHAHP